MLYVGCVFKKITKKAIEFAKENDCHIVQLCEGLYEMRPYLPHETREFDEHEQITEEVK